MRAVGAGSRCAARTVIPFRAAFASATEWRNSRSRASPHIDSTHEPGRTQVRHRQGARVRHRSRRSVRQPPARGFDLHGRGKALSGGSQKPELDVAARQRRPQKIRQELVSPTDTVPFGDVRMPMDKLLESIRLKFPSFGITPAPPLPPPEPTARKPWVQAKRLVRCSCGAVKTRGGACPECEQRTSKSEK